MTESTRQSLLPHAQRLVYTVLDLMPSGYQRRSLEVLPDWGRAAQQATEILLSSLLVAQLLINIERLDALAQAQGIQIKVNRCKM